MDVDRGRDQQPNGSQQPHGEGNDRPFLYIHSYPPPVLPHAEEDIGERPVPSSVCWYLCSGIQPLTRFEPGQDLTVQVSVGNWQGGNSASLAYVGVWWSKPVSGPVIPDASKFIGFSPVEVPPHGGRAETSPVTARIGASAGNHICLLAKVWHPLDNVAAGGLADPVNDRHWAQHNLTAMPASPPQPFAFLATNPADQEVTYQIDVRPMPRELWGNLPTDDRLRPTRASAWLSLTSTAAWRGGPGPGRRDPHGDARTAGAARDGTAGRRDRRGGKRVLRPLPDRPVQGRATGRRHSGTPARQLSTRRNAAAPGVRGTRGRGRGAQPRPCLRGLGGPRSLIASPQRLRTTPRRGRRSAGTALPPRDGGCGWQGDLHGRDEESRRMSLAQLHYTSATGGDGPGTGEAEPIPARFTAVDAAIPASVLTEAGPLLAYGTPAGTEPRLTDAALRALPEALSFSVLTDGSHLLARTVAVRPGPGSDVGFHAHAVHLPMRHPAAWRRPPDHRLPVRPLGRHHTGPYAARPPRRPARHRPRPGPRGAQRLRRLPGALARRCAGRPAAGCTDTTAPAGSCSSSGRARTWPGGSRWPA